MGSAYKRALHQRQREKMWDIAMLKEASHYFWMQEYGKAGRILFDLSQKIIVEPLKGTKEYEDGERKLEETYEEEEATAGESETATAKNEVFSTEDLFSEQGRYSQNHEPDRDNDGYLIR